MQQSLDLVPADRTWYQDVPRSGRKPVLMGFALLAVGVAGFGAWAATAPIEGAIVAPGVFVATSQNKIIQHLEGGIIKEILVREGDRVAKGQTLIRLDETQPKAELRRLMLRQVLLRATAARLAAEAEEKDQLVFPEDILASDNPDVKIILETQQLIFSTRKQKIIKELAVHEQSIASYQERIRGEQARLESSRTQLALIEEELAGKKRLFDQGLVRKPEYFALQRAFATVKGEIGRATAEIADNEERIRGVQEQIERVKKIAVQSALEELHGISGELRDIRERIIAAETVLSRIEVKAPVHGIVVKLNYHTPGGVVKPGNDILALLPLDDELVIEARVRPQDIDDLVSGQDATVRLTALSQRVTPMIPGKVIYVSADALPNEKGQGDNVYITRVKLDAAAAAAVENFVPTPGMPAEVYIRTGERTFFQYLMQPIIDTMTRAFRES